MRRFAAHIRPERSFEKSGLRISSLSLGLCGATHRVCVQTHSSQRRLCAIKEAVASSYSLCVVDCGVGAGGKKITPCNRELAAAGLPLSSREARQLHQFEFRQILRVDQSNRLPTGINHDQIIDGPLVKDF